MRRKSLHENFHGLTGIDLNRAGTPLLEIVSEPDMRSAKEAVAYMRKLHELVRYLGICDGNMQEGSFRCDANVSVRPKASANSAHAPKLKISTRSNLSKKPSIMRLSGKIELLESGGKVVQETRLYDSVKDETRSMRSKEEATITATSPILIYYRYLLMKTSKPKCAALPELPDAKKQRFKDSYNLDEESATILTSSRPLADFSKRSSKNRP